MAFDTGGKVESADKYLDIAFTRAAKEAKALKSTVPGHNRFQKSKTIELNKIRIIRSVLVDMLSHLIKNFPSVDATSEFYFELIECTIGTKKLKKSLGAVHWAASAVSKLSKQYESKLKKCEKMEEINQISGEFFGRASSVVKQIKNEFIFLENARKTMRGFPTIKEKFFTVAIAGFPNVGKTTLLHKLTGSKPDIASYAFTTRGINVSYFGSGENIIQVLDTPGTLNRLDKMNYIEKQAYLAIKYCAEVIVYVFDPTEPYSLSDQEKLFDRLNETGKDIIIYISKTDLIKDLSKFKQFNFITDAEEVKKAVLALKDV